MKAVSMIRAEAQGTLAHFRREMAFSPARLSSVLRMSLIIALATLVLLVVQAPPFLIAPSLFMLYLVSRETPADCFNGLSIIVGFGSLGTLTAICVVAVTGNAPIARILGLAVCTFICTFFFRASTMPVAALAFNCVYFLGTSLWESQGPAERILHLSLWPIATTFTVACCAMLVECLFNGSDSSVKLKREISARFQALEEMFSRHATRGVDETTRDKSAKVRQYVSEGPARMHLLLDQIAKAGDQDPAVATGTRGTILRLAQLLDLAAAIAVNDGLDKVEPERVARIAKALHAAREGRRDDVQATLGEAPERVAGELDQFEQVLHAIAKPGAASTQPAASAQNTGQPRRALLLPDAFTNSDYIFYALKVSICATVCYVIYNGLKWTGISTAYFTVLFTGLSTTGASNKKLCFRIIGSAIGGLFLGIGCLAFVFPNIENVAAFMLVIAAVTFLGTWIAASPYFGYIGMQIVFAFNLLAFEGYSAATEITPARDRLLGIALGLIVMLIVFHQVRPERTVDTMRQSLARMLRLQADLVHQMSTAGSLEASAAKVVALKAGIAQLRAAIQMFAEGVKFEFEPDRTGDLKISAEILNAVSTAETLLLSVQAASANAQLRESELRNLCAEMELGLCNLASTLEQISWSVASEAAQLEKHPGITEPKSVGKAIDTFRELRRLCQGIVSAET